MDVKMSSDCTPSFRNHQENISTPITILPVSAKMRNLQQNLIPKISLNKKNTIEKSMWPIANELNDDLSSIPDIPIIIASDDETINSIETSSLPLSIINSIPCEKRDKNIPTKVVLLSNKEDNKLNHSNSSETLITKNHSSASNKITGLKWNNQTASNSKNINNKPTIKYTKIILAKKNSLNQSNERVILTKNTKKLPTNQAYNQSQMKIEKTYSSAPVKIISRLSEQSDTADQVNLQAQDKQEELTTEITNIDQPSTINN